MKKVLLLLVLMGILCWLGGHKALPAELNSNLQNTPHQGGVAAAKPKTGTDRMLPVPVNRDLLRDPPLWQVSIQPVSIMNSFYDYMIGSPAGANLCVNPNQYGGYFLAYQGKRTATGTKRVHYAYLSDTGSMYNFNEITPFQIVESAPTIAIDPVSGKPFYAWHANADGTTDTRQEILIAWDAFLEGTAGIVTDPLMIINNPITIAPTTDNEFINPIVQIGPSPLAGRRRAYILGKNATTHTGGACENPYLAYADFDADMLETGMPLSWNYTSIPLMNQWNNDASAWRQPFYSFCVGNDGKVFVIGYHSNDLLDLPLTAPDLDVFVCGNYGQGTWEYYNHSSHIPAYNPHTGNGNGQGYFINATETPYADNELFLKITHSSHLNAVVDDNGIVHLIGMWGLGCPGGTPTNEINTIKEMTFNSSTHAFGIREIYPQAGTASDNFYWLPWDNDGNGSTDAYSSTTGNPVIDTDWNFPYWDEAAHDGTMIDQYNNLRITKPNSQGQMAAVWQNSRKARLFNEFDNDEYLAYADVPEIYIAVSADRGINWSEPIIINSLNVVQLSGMTPMWVYPADQVKYVSNGIGKLGLLFMDDNTWGSSVLTPPVGPSNGGVVRFMEIQIGISVNPPQPCGISGYILSAETNIPLINATITVGYHNVQTDANGLYRLPLPAGQYNMNIHAANYLNQSAQGVVVQAGAFTERNFRLSHVAMFGYVRDADTNQPISNATISVGNISATTDAAGYYRLLLNSGNYNLTVSAFNYTPQSISATVLINSDTRRDVYLIISNWQGMQGYVFTADGDLPLPNVTILANTAHTSTASNGYFRIPLAAGSYVVSFEANNYVSQTLPHVVVDTCTIVNRSIYMDLRTNSVHGVVLNSYDLVPIPGAEVVVTGGGNTLSVFTNSQGFFEIGGLINSQSYNMAISLSGYDRFFQQFSQNGNWVELPPTVLYPAQGMPRNVIATVVSNDLLDLEWSPPGVESNRNLINYTIWRMLASQQDNPANWSLLGTMLPNVLSFSDYDLPNLADDTYVYAVKAIYTGDVSSPPAFSNPIYPQGSEADNLPVVTTRLTSAAPNPFAGTTLISYDLKSPGKVKIDIYNLTGQHVHSLIASPHKSGRHSVAWNGTAQDGKSLPSGVYLCRMQAAAVTSTLKIVLLK